MAFPRAWLLGPLWQAPRRPGDSENPAQVLQRHLTWRRNALVVVVAVTALTVVADLTAARGGTPRSGFRFVLRLDPEEGPVRQTWFGDLGDFLWDASLYAMPVAALAGLALGRRPRVSRSVLLVGWITSFLLPVAIALTPWSWWEVEPPPPTSAEGRVLRQYERMTEGLVWGNYYLVALSPAVLALVPGVLRACVRVKRLLPESSLAGWFLVAAAPFNGLLILVTAVALAQFSPSPLLVAGMLLWVAAPLAYLAKARAFTRPLASAEDLRGLDSVQLLAWVLMLVSWGCLLTYAGSWQLLGWRLVGLDPKSSLVRPWDVARYGLDFLGRSLFVTVLGADLLLRASVSAWRHERDFWRSGAGSESDRLMEVLDRSV